MPKWRAIVQGIQLIAKANDGQILIFARHDEFYVTGGHKSISYDDQGKLKEMGWSFFGEATWSITT